MLRSRAQHGVTSLPLSHPSQSNRFEPEHRYLGNVYRWLKARTRHAILAALLVAFWIACRAFIKIQQDHKRSNQSLTRKFVPIRLVHSREKVPQAISPGGTSLSENGDPPLVDRAALLKLQLIDAVEVFSAYKAVDPLEDKSSLWPPIISKIPESRTFSSPSTGHTDLAYDRIFCSTPPCRFLVPAWMPDRESDARHHFLQVAELALTLNLTLVLPNVGKGRIGACFRNYFSLYYDVQAFISASDEIGLRVVSLDTFTQWVSGRPSNPVGQVVVVDPEALPADCDGLLERCLSGAMVQIHDQTHIALSHHKHCLKSRASRLLFGPFVPMHINPVSGTANVGDNLHHMYENNSLFAAALSTALSSPMRGHQESSTRGPRFTWSNDLLDYGDRPNMPDVLVVDWGLRYPIYATPRLPLSYSPRLRKFASYISSELNPFIKVDSDIEGLSSERLCAGKLVDALRGLLPKFMVDGENHPPTIWLTGNFSRFMAKPAVSFFESEGGAKTQSGNKTTPAEPPRPLLDTVNSLSEIFREEFGPNVKLINLSEALVMWGDSALATVGLGLESLEDPGVTGIIERIVASDAKWTLKASEGPCSRAVPPVLDLK